MLSAYLAAEYLRRFCDDEVQKALGQPFVDSRLILIDCKSLRTVELCMRESSQSLKEWSKALGLSKSANALGVSKKVLWAWINRGQVPANRAPAVSARTGIPLSELRPKDWGEIWRDGRNGLNPTTQPPRGTTL